MGKVVESDESACEVEAHRRNDGAFIWRVEQQWSTETAIEKKENISIPLP